MAKPGLTQAHETTSVQDLPVLPVEEPAFWQDIHGPIQDAQAAAAVARTNDGGLWLLRHSDVERCLKDPGFLAADLLAMMGLNSGPVWEWWARMMFSNNAPVHTRIRRLVSRAFTPRRMEQERVKIRAMADSLVSRAVEADRIDVMETIAHHLPSMVMAQFLHIPEADREIFAEWTTDIGLAFGAVGDPDVKARVERALANLDEYVISMVAERRKSGGDDLISELIRVEEVGDKLSNRELVDLIENLLFAGHDTTRGAIGAMLWLLIDNPVAMQAIRSDPALIPNAVNEVLRYEAITFSTSRTASQDTVVGGVRIAAGTPVGFCLAAASRDARRYDQPMVFDVRRPNPAPPTFGAGAHYCIGAALANIELEELMHSLVQLAASLEAVAEPQWMPFAYIRRFERFDLSLRR